MKYCLIGEKLSHSYSAEIHAQMGLEYTLNEVKKENLKKFVDSGEFDGFNVTIPYKKDIMHYLDQVDDLAERIGAVNTVKRVDGILYGYNTDYYGLKMTFANMGVDLKGKKVAILGSGGAKNTAYVLCEDCGAKEIYVVSRSGEINYTNVYSLEIDVIINTTPVGMYPKTGVSMVDLKRIKGVSAVVDLIYNPIKTALILQAEQLGVKYANGLLMLVAQAIKAEEIWLDKTFSEQEITNAYLKLLSSKRNIILIGMPASGKSTLGRLVSASLNREFIDTDEEIYKRTGNTPAEIIMALGERAFRDIESRVCYDLGKLSGVVISTGGGSVLREENREDFKQNGTIFYIKRDLDKLITKGRPLSQDKGLDKLFEERRAIYEGLCDFEIDNNGDVLNALKEIIKRV